jgi:nucleoid DNA-binding protein
MKNYLIEKGLGSKTDPELVSELARVMKLPVQEVKTVIDYITDGIKKNLEKNGVVNIRKFGRFYICKRKRAKFKNFKGVMVEIPISYSVKFKASSSLRSLVNRSLVVNKGKALREKS